MEYQKIINLLDNMSNQLTLKQNWIEINDQSNTNSDIRFAITMLNSSLYDYIHAYILVRNNSNYWRRR